MFVGYINDQMTSLNTSKVFAGFVMIILNIGSRYIDVKFSKSQERAIKYIFNKELLVFAVSWMGTRDIYISFVISIVFSILMNIMLNDESEYCVLPESMTNYTDLDSIDLNGDGEITDDEVRAAKKLIDTAVAQRRKRILTDELISFSKCHT